MLIPLGILAIVAGLLVVLYNSLVKLRVLADNAWADIDVQLKRRHDLVPNLVETVKGYSAFERGTIEGVVEARAKAMAATGPQARGEAEFGLSAALGKLFALAEAYPQLRAVETYAQLQTTLASLEDALQQARRYYNAVVRDLNTRIAQVPWNLIAGLFGFAPRQFFQLADETERAVPPVTFS